MAVAAVADREGWWKSVGCFFDGFLPSRGHVRGHRVHLCSGGGWQCRRCGKRWEGK